MLSIVPTEFTLANHPPATCLDLYIPLSIKRAQLILLPSAVLRTKFYTEKQPNTRTPAAFCGYPVSGIHGRNQAQVHHTSSVLPVTMVRNGSPSPADNFPLGHSATSPQLQPSKRDKRRNMLAEKLSDMMASFSDNRDSHYRAQLAAIQADMNLIMKADPYQNQPLEDGGDESSELISQIMGNNMPSAPSAGTDYIAQCGRHYSRFVDAVNDAMEERDYNLTMLWVSPIASHCVQIRY
jgi:hypothetical protein